MRFTLQPSIPCNRYIDSRYFVTNEAIKVSFDCTISFIWAVAAVIILIIALKAHLK